MTNYSGNRLVGFRFHPTDQELISYFLYKKAIAKEPLMASYSNIVHDFNPLGETEPWVVWDIFGGPDLIDEDLYFFSELKNLSPKGSRIKRKIEAGGTWSEAFSKKVYDETTGNPIGRKRNLRYENEGCEHHGKWLLEEYSLVDQETQKIVLCRLKKNNRVWNKINNSTQESKEKPSNKKARKGLGSPWIKIEDEEPHRTSGQSSVYNNLDQELIIDTNYNAISNNICGDNQDNMLMTSDFASDPACFDYGGLTDEEYVFDVNELLATVEPQPLSMELPQMAETLEPLLSSGLGDDRAGEAWNSSGLENAYATNKKTTSHIGSTIQEYFENL
ncbi:hypothetical protein ACE6H2_019260 [Prunus campanulata]